MSDGQAAARVQLREVATNGAIAADIHITAEPQTAPGTLLDATGAEITARKPGLMARVDEKGAETVTLRRSTIWFVATGLVLLQVIFNYGGSFIGWARDDQSQKEQMTTMKGQVDETRNDMRDLKSQFTALQKVLQDQAIATAKKEGYELGAVDGKTGHANVK